MRLVAFGLSISSSLGNGHATLWRALAHGLAEAGHRLVFFERDVPSHAAHRDMTELPWGELVLYRTWDEVLPTAQRALDRSDAAIVTSYCLDGAAASRLVLDSRTGRVFYDLDTPVTLERLAAGDRPEYLPREGLADFDLVLSVTGGSSLALLRQWLDARFVAPLYACVDPAAYEPPRTSRTELAANLSYLGTYAADRQAMLEALLFEPARQRPDARFVVGGSQYPVSLVWPPNVRRVPHVAPRDHAAFYCSSPVTLSVTRSAMAACGYCPSRRLFEAAACGVPVLSDRWPGLERFFTPGQEILVADGPEDTLDVLQRSPRELADIGAAARDRVLASHTGRQRAAELVHWIERATSSSFELEPIDVAPQRTEDTAS